MSKYIVARTDGTPIPKDEPMFVIRGQDVLVCEMIRHYIEEYKVHTARYFGLNPECQKVEEDLQSLLDKVNAWPMKKWAGVTPRQDHTNRSSSSDESKAKSVSRVLLDVLKHIAKSHNARFVMNAYEIALLHDAEEASMKDDFDEFYEAVHKIMENMYY